MLEAKQRLNLGVSHELRSPLTRARLQIEMMQDEQQRDELLNEINAMEAIISNLLDSEAINYGHKKLDLKTFNIENAIKELTSKAPYLENIKIVISSNIKSKEVEADQILFEVMIKNVLENASRFTSSEDSRIEIDLDEVGAD